MDSSVERIKLGDMILFSTPGNATPISMLVSRIDLPVDEPGDATYTLGTSYKTMTETQINARKDGKDGKDGKKGEDATLLRIESSRGTVFKMTAFPPYFRR